MAATESDKSNKQFLKLEDLETKSKEELDAIYLKAETPEIEELQGKYDGKVLSGDFFPLNMKEGVQIANLPLNRWGGKHFTPINEDEAKGYNWFDLGFTEVEGYEFIGRHTPAIYGENDCYIFDYDIPGNPVFIRNVRDELKRVRPGLYLGRMYAKFSDVFRFVLYFGLKKH